MNILGFEWPWNAVILLGFLFLLDMAMFIWSERLGRR